MVSPYYIHQDGQWAEVDIESGKVVGGERVKFFYVRGGRLELAKTRDVLAGLRALAAGRRSTVRLGANLPDRRELEATWAIMEFDYMPHDRTGIKLPKASEELVEILEDNQNQVQNMMSSKFIGFYETEVTVWQKKLGTADAVIALWFEVQRKWQYLESIFVGSDDIRSQLPEDSKRFDGIDKTFKELLRDIAATPNVVQATNKPGLLDKLDELMKNLNLCEKALNDYLETKRLAYPRFYFVSSADLLGK